MKRKSTFLIMALVGMFAFSTPAEAQWGSLLNKARKAAGIKTKQEKAVDAEKHRQDSIQEAIRSITPTIPQPAKSGAPIAIKWQNTQIGTWDPVKLEITFNKTYEDGEFAGQKVSYKLDPNTGKWTSKKGSDVGSISNDGTIESPNLGTLKFDPEKCTVSYEGTIIGKANLKNAYIFDKEIGGFEGHKDVRQTLLADIHPGVHSFRYAEIQAVAIDQLVRRQARAGQLHAKGDLEHKSAGRRRRSVSLQPAAILCLW